MARHVITIPYRVGGAGELIWDDEAGTVEGDHYQAAYINEWIAEGGIPLDLSGDGRSLILADPLHDPRDFLWLLPDKMWEEPLRSTLPAILLEVEPTPFALSKPPIIVVDGVRREAIEGVDFVW